MKKTLSLFLSLIIILSGLVFPINSYAAGDFKSMNADAVCFDNPMYSGEEIPSSAINSYISESSKSAKYKNHTYYTKGKELYTSIKKGIEKRQKTITVYYLSSQAFSSPYVLRDLITDFFMSATDDEISSTCTDGDYARWVVSSGSIDLNNSTLDKQSSGKYYYKLVLIYAYYDTADQEKQVSTVVNKFINSLDTNILSDYEIMKKIHDFICNKTTYDYDALYSPYNNTHAFTAYGALVKGKSVCQGYAVAFYRICKELGYKVRFVSSDPNEGCHAWNIVQIDNKYYFVDCTWDDQIRDEKDDADLQEIFNNNSYYYFLVNYDTLRNQDGTSYAHTLYEDLYENKYFHMNYSNYLSEADYDLTNENIFSKYTVSLSAKSYVYSNKAYTPKVTVKKNDGTVLTQNVDYKVTYSANKNSGLARVRIDGLDRYKGSATHRTFIIIPKKMTSLSLVSSSRTSSSLTLKWTKDSSVVTGYVIERYDSKSKKYKPVKTITGASTTSCKITSLSANATHKFRIRAYKDISSRRYYGAYSNVYTNVTLPKKPSVSKLKTKSKSITVSWKKVSCSGYQIQYSTNSSMKGAKTVNVSSKSASKKIAKLKKGKKYYVRIRAYKTYKNPTTKKTTKYYTAWSGKKSIKCK